MTSLPGDAGASAGAVRASTRPASPKPAPAEGADARAIGAEAKPSALSWLGGPVRAEGPRDTDPSGLGTLPRHGTASPDPSPGAADGLASLRLRAQLARQQLGEQPLPIANQSSRLIMKLLGG